VLRETPAMSCLLNQSRVRLRLILLLRTAVSYDHVIAAKQRGREGQLATTYEAVKRSTGHTAFQGWMTMTSYEQHLQYVTQSRSKVNKLERMTIPVFKYQRPLVVSVKIQHGHLSDTPQSFIFSQIESVHIRECLRK
jgi:hypothetical protein